MREGQASRRTGTAFRVDFLLPGPDLYPEFRARLPHVDHRMPDPLSPNVQHLKASETVAISNEAKRRKAAGEDVRDLGVGEPDFDTPAPAAQAGIQAIQKGLTRYPPNVGIAELRKGIAGQLSRMSGGRAVDPDQLVVSSGSKQSIFNAC